MALTLPNMVRLSHYRRRAREATVQYSVNYFNKLAIEMVQEIASHLDDDQDVYSFEKCCQSAANAIQDGGFWMRRFKEVFDKPRSGSDIKNKGQFRKEYERRRRVLNKVVGGGDGDHFKDGHTWNERECLAVLRNLILDSYSGQIDKNSSVYVSKNVACHLANFCKNHDIVWSLFKRPHSQSPYSSPPANPLLRTIQIMLTPFMLNNDPSPAMRDVFQFPDSQQMAYSSAASCPIFKGCYGLDVDMSWTLHQLNFWKYHMLRPEECSLYQAFAALEEHEVPRFWQNQLKNNDDDHIGMHWKGAYGFVSHDSLSIIRDGANEDEHIQDEFNSDDLSSGDFQDLRLTVTEDGEKTWHPLFEHILGSLRRPTSKARTRAQKGSSSAENVQARPRSFRFGGEGDDGSESFRADGFFNALPPQQGIPGWQRMTMMKYFTDEDTGAIDQESLWAYEGVVLPGAQIIVGRWWSPQSIENDGDMYSGPFILWCVDSKGCKE